MIIQFDLRWVKGHAKQEHVNRGLVTLFEVSGNYAADIFADHAAEVGQVSEEDVKKFHVSRTTCRDVQLRNISVMRHIFRNFREQREHEATPKVKPPSTMALLQATLHKLSLEGARLRCSVCHKLCPLTQERRRKFLRSPCKAPGVPRPTSNVTQAPDHVRLEETDVEVDSDHDMFPRITSVPQVLEGLLALGSAWGGELEVALGAHGVTAEKACERLRFAVALAEECARLAEDNFRRSYPVTRKSP